ncbi:NAD-dependent epimerase/dehydratase family protein [Salidesulfovibrio brasiliensis]|uniref:NAD-dependent epimerase/dehydratase family protein n=1 Tax=Salidesulfovibrio brasiliensis TaxID=221711 RepID=UPI0006D1CFED|nr:NAD(P)-dependent oxidoreductase [Salidesulfovibrio brasiliensis]
MSQAPDTIVFGGSGFLGSHIADALSDKGHRVTVFDRAPSPWLRPDQSLIQGDILDREQVGKAVAGKDYVYHLAGIADIGQSSREPLETIQHNVIGSSNIIDAAAEADVSRLLFASSLYVYTDKGSFYRVSKQAVEAVLEAYNQQSGLEYTILRYGSLYGPRAQDWNGLRSIVKQAIRGGDFTYPGTGEERREYIHVADAASLSVDALSSEYANKCLTVSGITTLTIKEVLEIIKEVSGKDTDIRFSPSGDEYASSHYSMTPYRYTPKRAHKVVPSVFVDFGQGILELIEEIDHQENGH